MLENTVTPKQFAKRLQIAYTTVIYNMDKGVIDYLEYGNEYYINTSEIAKYKRVKQLGITTIGEQEYLTVTRLAKYLGMTYHLCRKLVLDRQVPHRRIKGHRYVSFEVAQELLREEMHELECKSNADVDEFLDSL